MDFFEAVKKRQSVRRFESKAIPQANLNAILESANQAPSAGNLQAYRIVAVKKESLRKIFAGACGDQDFVAEAPVVLVFCADPQRAAFKYGARGERLYCIQDATVACAYAQLAATALGLTSVWVGAILDPEAIQAAIGLTGKQWPVALLPVGYPAEVPERTPRRPLDDLVEIME